MTTTTVYLNEGKDHFFGFKNEFSPAALRKAAEFDQAPELIAQFQDTGKPIRALEDVFAQLNIDSPTADWAVAYRAERNRSLSVGDVVVIGETAWAVASFGWDRISSEDLAAAIWLWDQVSAQ